MEPGDGEGLREWEYILAGAGDLRERDKVWIDRWKAHRAETGRNPPPRRRTIDTMLRGPQALPDDTVLFRVATIVTKTLACVPRSLHRVAGTRMIIHTAGRHLFGTGEMMEAVRRYAVDDSSFAVDMAYLAAKLLGMYVGEGTPVLSEIPALSVPDLAIRQYENGEAQRRCEAACLAEGIIFLSDYGWKAAVAACAPHQLATDLANDSGTMPWTDLLGIRYFNRYVAPAISTALPKWVRVRSGDPSSTLMECIAVLPLALATNDTAVGTAMCPFEFLAVNNGVTRSRPVIHYATILTLLPSSVLLMLRDRLRGIAQEATPHSPRTPRDTCFRRPKSAARVRRTLMTRAEIRRVSHAWARSRRLAQSKR